MENKNGNKITLGIFVSVGIVLLIICIYFIGAKQQLFNQTFQISALFRDVNGLQVGNNVRFSGINVGVVGDVEIVSDTTVRVDFNIDENSRKFIKEDAQITIGSDGLMGNKIAIIIPGHINKKIIKDNDFVKTSVPVSIDDILIKLHATTKNTAEITEDLAVIMNNIRSGKGTIGKLFMDTVFSNNIDQTLVNLKHGAGDFDQNMKAASHNILLRGYFKKKKEKETEKK